MGCGDLVNPDIRHSPALAQIGRSLPAMCTIYGELRRIDDSLAANASVTFDSRVAQVLGGAQVQPMIVSRSTDADGQLQWLVLAQGLVCQITVHDNGVTYPPSTVRVPMSGRVSFSQLLAGVEG